MNKIVPKSNDHSEQFPSVKLSVKNEARYMKMEEDFKSGRNVKSANSVEEFMKELRS